MGGAKGGFWDLVPLCREHHREQEGRNMPFKARHGLDLPALALDLLELDLPRLRRLGAIPEDAEIWPDLRSALATLRSRAAPPPRIPTG
jgi:hypothetical protein